VLERYDAYKRGDFAAAANPVPSELASTSQARNELSLIDFDDAAPPTTGGGAGGSGANDLVGLFGGPGPSTQTHAMGGTMFNTGMGIGSSGMANFGMGVTTGAGASGAAGASAYTSPTPVAAHAGMGMGTGMGGMRPFGASPPPAGSIPGTPTGAINLPGTPQPQSPTSQSAVMAGQWGAQPSPGQFRMGPGMGGGVSAHAGLFGNGGGGTSAIAAAGQGQPQSQAPQAQKQDQNQSVKDPFADLAGLF
jgi:ADP-ribosylation factor-binding protein GGA